MELLLSPLLLVGLIMMGPIIALNAYVMVWLCGPAIRRAGRKWEEGRNQAIAGSRELAEGKKPFAPFGYAENPAGERIHINTALRNPIEQSMMQPRIPVKMPGGETVYTAGDPNKGDAGHRWLGEKDKKGA